MERTTSCTLRQASLPILLVGGPLTTHPGVLVVDAGPPSTVLFPAWGFLTTKFILIGSSVRVAKRLFSALIEFFFLASDISSGSRESKEIEETVVAVDKEDLSVSGLREAETIYHIDFVSYQTMMTSTTDFTHTKRSQSWCRWFVRPP